MNKKHMDKEVALIKERPKCRIEVNKILDIFYSSNRNFGLMDMTRGFYFSDFVNKVNLTDGMRKQATKMYHENLFLDKC